MNSGIRLGAMGLIVVLLLGMTGCQEAGQAPTMPPPGVVVATPIVREVIEWDYFTGRLQPVESVEVRARVSGYLDQYPFQGWGHRGGGRLTLHDRPSTV